MKPMQARGRGDRFRTGLVATGCVLLAGSLPAHAQATGDGNGWAWVCVLLALLLGGWGWLWGLRHRRERRHLLRQLNDSTAGQRKAEGQLQAASRERDELAGKLHQQSVEFERQAHEDPLTGLPNGRAFDEGFAHHFARSQRHGQALCLMMLDIDHLRQINDDWSHAIGDQVLVEAARLLRSVCRTSDLPARLGGDGFAVILTDTDQEGGKRFSQRLHNAFASCRSWHDGEFGPNYVSFSAGLVQLGEEDRAPVQLRQRADRALYLAKHAGGSRTSMG